MTASTALGSILAVGLALAACSSATPSRSTPSEPAPVTPTPSAASASDPEAARDLLCDPEDEAGMAHLAAELGSLEEMTDADGLAARAGRAVVRLEALSLGPDGMSVRDAAVGALLDLQAGLGEGSPAPSSAAIAAQMLQGLQGHVCGPAEI